MLVGIFGLSNCGTHFVMIFEGNYKISLSNSPNDIRVKIPAGQNGLVLWDWAALKPKKIALNPAMKAATLMSFGFS